MTERGAFSGPEFEALRDLARSAREHAYAPYSKYRVGAALRTSQNHLFSGCNVENASYGATLCAERAAIAAMVSSGERRIDVVVVFTDEGPPGMPCGICRQALLEFAGPECLVVATSPRETKHTTLGALLPEPFVLSR